MFLALERDGVVVLLRSLGYPTTDDTGEIVQLEPLDMAALIALAGRLEPAT